VTDRPDFLFIEYSDDETGNGGKYIMEPSALTARLEAFDTFWEAPENIEKGFSSFGKFYKRNYSKFFPEDKTARILVISCGPGYFVNLMKQEGYTRVLGIDSDEEKIGYAKKRGLNCRVERAFGFLENNRETFDLIFAEQEINHLTKDEIVHFLKLCRANLSGGGKLIIHSLNGSNPITGSDALAQNIDHFNTFTEYSLKQLLRYSKFNNITISPLKLYIFYENPLNYIGLAIDAILHTIMKLCFIYYGKKNQIFTKKLAAICIK